MTIASITTEQVQRDGKNRAAYDHCLNYGHNKEMQNEGKIIIAHEHCLISHEKEGRDVDHGKIAHDHCIKHYNNHHCSSPFPQSKM